MRLSFLTVLLGTLLFRIALTAPHLNPHRNLKEVHEKEICAASCSDQECPRIICDGLPCADCLNASGKDLTLTPDTDPLWIPNPDFQVSSSSNRFSPVCRWAIRFYLYAVNPNRSDNTMYRMCSSITEFGSTAIICLAEDFPEVALTAMGQYVRCCYAKKALGEEWGTEKGEETVFMDAPTNASMSAVDFIRDGFQLSKTKRKA